MSGGREGRGGEGRGGEGRRGSGGERRAGEGGEDETHVNDFMLRIYLSIAIYLGHIICVQIHVYVCSGVGSI